MTPWSSARLAPVATALLCAIAAVAACKKEAPGTAAPTDGGGAYDGADSAVAEEPAPADLPELQAELDRLEAELAAAGAGTDPMPESSDPQSAQARCARICDLSAAVCDLEARICALADEHAGEDRYTSVCARAGGDCERASEACSACSG